MHNNEIQSAKERYIRSGHGGHNNFAPKTQVPLFPVGGIASSLTLESVSEAFWHVSLGLW